MRSDGGCRQRRPYRCHGGQLWPAAVAAAAAARSGAADRDDRGPSIAATAAAAADSCRFPSVSERLRRKCSLYRASAVGRYLPVIQPTTLIPQCGRPRHRRWRPSAGGREAEPLSGSVQRPHCGACKWPPCRAGASGMGALKAAQCPSPARRSWRTAPPPAAAVDRRPKEGGLRTRGASGNWRSRPATAINRPRRRRRRRRRRQPPPPPGGRCPPQAGGLSSTAAAVGSSASCGRPACASAAARDGGGRRRRGG